ncbi:MAG: hypothetical protein ACQEQC_08985 [Elusimicrobiota bacterium]
MKKVLIILSIVFFIPALAWSGNKMAAGINYPGLSFKYFVNEEISVEPKIQFGDNVFAGGIRGNYYFTEIIYSGVEMDYISFKGEISEGSGMAASVYGGLEMQGLENITLQLDIGPVFMILADKNYDVSENYFEMMGNIGLNYYFK